MTENIMIQPLFHQRSHSMPVGQAFINTCPLDHTNNMEHNTDNQSTFAYYKRSSTLKPDPATPTSIEFPLPIPKSMTTQFRSPLSERNEEDDPSFFCAPKTILNVINVNKKENCPVILNCKIDRGFFVSQSHWTCYRRNYFQATTSFIIPGHSDQTCYALQLNPDRPMQPIKQFLVRIKACTSTSSSIDQNDEATLKNHNLIRPIALTQMTPKRDKGPQREPPSVPINPSVNVFNSEHCCVTFERLQFRVATANNGKRRASQQYFRLVFELIAQLDDETQHVVSECYSLPLVVRGRSPGHYNNDPQYEVKKKRKSPPRQKTPPSLPPPQYVYAPPSMVIDTTQTSESTNNNSPVSYTSPHIMNTSFGNNFHGRSQSANDTEFFARHRKYMQHNGELYDTGVERALRNWQQQVRQRADSFNSYDNYQYQN